MNADVDACIKERKKKELPDLEVVMMMHLSIRYVWCFLFFLLLSFLLTVDIAIAAYCMLWNYSPCYIHVVAARATFLWF